MLLGIREREGRERSLPHRDRRAPGVWGPPLGGWRESPAGCALGPGRAARSRLGSGAAHLGRAGACGVRGGAAGRAGRGGGGRRRAERGGEAGALLGGPKLGAQTWSNGPARPGHQVSVTLVQSGTPGVSWGVPWEPGMGAAGRALGWVSGWAGAHGGVRVAGPDPRARHPSLSLPCTHHQGEQIGFSSSPGGLGPGALCLGMGDLGRDSRGTPKSGLQKPTWCALGLYAWRLWSWVSH